MEIYLFSSLIVVLISGWILYTHGKAWSLEFINDIQLGEKVNRILLVLFYLFNSGLILVSILVWNDRDQELIYAFERIGIALASIGLLHLLNVLGFLIVFHFKLFQK